MTPSDRPTRPREPNRDELGDVNGRRRGGALRSQALESVAVVPNVCTVWVLRPPRPGTRTHAATVSRCTSRPAHRSISWSMIAPPPAMPPGARRRALRTILLAGLEAPLRGSERAHANFNPDSRYQKSAALTGPRRAASIAHLHASGWARAHDHFNRRAGFFFSRTSNARALRFADGRPDLGCCVAHRERDELWGLVMGGVAGLGRTPPWGVRRGCVPRTRQGRPSPLMIAFCQKTHRRCTRVTVPNVASPNRLR
jgi:hypothetical protein